VFARKAVADDSHWLTIRIVCIREIATVSARAAIPAPSSTLRVRRFKAAESCTVDISAERKRESTRLFLPRPENSGLLDLNASLMLNSISVSCDDPEAAINIPGTLVSFLARDNKV
jgi:hypothetical protein